MRATLTDYRRGVASTYRPVLAAVRDTGGATFTRSGRLVTSGGWAVGGVPGAVVLREPIATFTTGDVHRTVVANRGVETFGAWTDSHGIVWVEPITLVADPGDAVDLGTERHEIAIFDLDTGREVRL